MKKENDYISKSEYSKRYGVGKTIIAMRIANGILKEKNNKVKIVKYNA